MLVDGIVAGSWSKDRKKNLATLRIEAFRDFDAAERAAVVDEGERLARFLEPAVPAVEVKLSC